MKKLILIAIGVGVLCLSGCDSSSEKKEVGKQESSKEVAKKFKRGDPLPGGL